MVRLLTVPDGVDLVETLSRELSGGSGWVSACGSLDSVELQLASESGDAQRGLRGRFVLASLAGIAGGPYRVVLSRVSEMGLETVGGILLRGRALGVSVCHFPADSTSPAVAAAPAKVAEPVKAPVASLRPDVAGVPGVPPGPAVEGSRWAAIAQAATAASAGDQLAADGAIEDAEDQYPEPGDLIQHFAFGMCEVLMSDGETLRIRDVKADGRVREIRTDVLEVQPPIMKDGKRLFKMTRKS